MVPGGFLWLFKVPAGFSTLPGRFSWFFTVLTVFMVFKVPGWVFHGSKWVFMDTQRCRAVFIVFHGSRSVFMVFKVFRSVFHEYL